MKTCPRCGSPEAEKTNDAKETGRTWWVCGTHQTRDFHPHNSELCLEREEKLQTMRERDEARNLANGAMLEADIIRGKLERERGEAQRLLAAANESLNAIHVEVGGWIAAMMKEEKQTLPTVAKTQNTNEHRTK